MPAALVVLVAAGCQVRTTVDVEVAEDGSGVVTVSVQLDEDALARVPDDDGDGVASPADVGALIRTDDLVAAGWTVDEPVASDGGGAVLRVSRSFGTPAEADQILGELSGSDGALHDLTVRRSTSFGRTSISFAGTADLSSGIEAFGDEGLAAALEGEPLGEDAAVIEDRIGEPLAEALTVEVTADLDGEEHAWSPRLGGAPVAMRAERNILDVPVLMLAGIALAAAVALVVVLSTRLIRSRRET